jgi:hypothetical protein
MPKRAVSVTLEQDNLLWLQSRATALKRRSLSDALDAVVTDARLAGRVSLESIRSVAGTVDISPADPALEGADDAVRAVFEASLARPMLVRDERASYGRRKSSSAGHRRG